MQNDNPVPLQPHELLNAAIKSQPTEQDQEKKFQVAKEIYIEALKSKLNQSPERVTENDFKFAATIAEDGAKIFLRKLNGQ